MHKAHDHSLVPQPTLTSNAHIMAIDIPPIVVHLFYLLPKLVLKPLLLYAAIRISAVDAPTWTTIAACLLTQPAFFLVSLAYRAHSQRSFAKSHGAVTVPRIKGNMVQTSRAIMKSFMQNPIPGLHFTGALTTFLIRLVNSQVTYSMNGQEYMEIRTLMTFWENQGLVDCDPNCCFYS